MACWQQIRHFYGTIDHHVAGITYAIYTASIYIINRYCNGNFMLFTPACSYNQ